MSARKKTPESESAQQKSPSQMSDDEVIAFYEAEKKALAARIRENIERTGSPLGASSPTPALTARGLVMPARPKSVKFEVVRKGALNPKWKDVTKVCPNCGKSKNVAEDFGIVARRGWEYAASWCRTCRSKTNYKKVPRKYKTKRGEPGEER